MLLDKKYQSDTAPISMIVQSNESVWEYVYHKYAPMMYGIILKMTENQTIAEEIFKDVFLELKEKKMISEIHPALCLDLLRHTYKSCLKHLKASGLTPLNAQPFNVNYPVINLFCFEQTTLVEAATRLAISEPEALQKLRAEFNQFRDILTANMGIM